ncbi:MAG: pyruvate formate-lyase-activating protein [Syntrophomonadaceae bacterium]|nr:pyruvate formate-lyase-activating protein [Syntrophomonadaceae bacterium]MDD3024574.1 pyruvate formate-lyase-activating protein [Syntrophomonadaceae bacterium]
MIGNVHSVDTFSTLDGPGIRTVIFMQGCHLRCQYCHNPDTWDCKATTAKPYESSEVLRIIERNLPYFQASGGGVTFSGGEPLLQHEFVKAVLEKCQHRGIHTAIDTSLYVTSSHVTELIPYTNLFLADIKQMNNEKSKALTGAGNRLNLHNLYLINERKTEIWIRYVVVPGLTDDENDITSLGRFIARLDWVKRVDLLPYHSLGSHKWPLLGLEYKLVNTPAPTAVQMIDLQSKLETTGGKPVFIPGNMI